MQGEPLNNYEAVRAAVSMLTDGRTFGFRRQKVTISTVGVVPRIQQVVLLSLLIPVWLLGLKEGTLCWLINTTAGGKVPAIQSGFPVQ